MTPGFPLLSYLPIASFAISAGGLAVRLLWPSGPAKQTLIAASFLFLLLVSALLWQQQREERRQIREAAEEIVTVIGNRKLTYDELLLGPRHPNYLVANAAIDLLIDEKRIGTENTTIIDRLDHVFHVRLYFVRTF